MAEVLFQTRPKRIAIYAAISGVVLIATMTTIALSLVKPVDEMREDGIYFRSADVIAMVGLGVLFAAGLMLLARPRLRMTTEGVLVRNVLGEREVPWALVERLSFPESAQWAKLEIADDEAISVMAIQAMDRRRAVTALGEAREVMAKYVTPRTKRAPAQPVTVPRVDPDRPLGRLERIDREMAAKSPRRPR